MSPLQRPCAPFFEAGGQVAPLLDPAIGVFLVYARGGVEGLAHCGAAVGLVAQRERLQVEVQLRVLEVDLVLVPLAYPICAHLVGSFPFGYSHPR